MIYLYAFITCGAICTLGQLLFDHTNFTAGHITSLFVVLGGLLDFFDLYDRLVSFAGAGALLPITSFGHTLMHAAMQGASQNGFLGLVGNMLSTTSAGITTAITCAFFIALVFKPKL
ncbi:MAG: SpoVA/SpoVAEb family sporulation membrane protein [Erysipelotrichaceae bacterium]|nr:SpoVA/SpoVAEb family sporulation membrane protein [Erysipelotrichaceae bacterium]